MNSEKEQREKLDNELKQSNAGRSEIQSKLDKALEVAYNQTCVSHPCYKF